MVMSGLELPLLLVGLFLVAILYSSVGHGGASGYLAVMSLTSYGMMEAAWLKQHAWFLNLVVASLAFYQYRKEGFHDFRLTMPFIIASVPMAFIGGFLRIDGMVYDLLLSLTLLWAALRLFNSVAGDESYECDIPTFSKAAPWGAGIGLASGVIGGGGGIFLSPIVLLKRWATPKGAAATSALFIWVNSMSGLVGATASGQLTLEVDTLTSFIGVVLVGGFIGSSYGAKFAPQTAIRKLLVAVLLLAAGKRLLGLAALLVT